MALPRGHQNGGADGINLDGQAMEYPESSTKPYIKPEELSMEELRALRKNDEEAAAAIEQQLQNSAEFEEQAEAYEQERQEPLPPQTSLRRSSRATKKKARKSNSSEPTGLPPSQQPPNPLGGTIPTIIPGVNVATALDDMFDEATADTKPETVNNVTTSAQAGPSTTNKPPPKPTKGPGSKKKPQVSKPPPAKTGPRAGKKEAAEESPSAQKKGAAARGRPTKSDIPPRSQTTLEKPKNAMKPGAGTLPSKKQPPWPTKNPRKPPALKPQRTGRVRKPVRKTGVFMSVPALKVAGKDQPKWSPGAIKNKALREIWRLQNNSHLVPLIKKAPFVRIVRDILHSYMPDARIQESAIAALMEASESTIVSLISAAHLATIHAKRVTLMPKDIHLVFAIMRMTRHLNIDTLTTFDHSSTHNVASIEGRVEMDKKIAAEAAAEEDQKAQARLELARKREDRKVQQQRATRGKK